MKPHRLGELSVETVVENACVAMPFADFLPGIDAQMLAAEKAWLVPRFADAALQNGILSFHSYLLRTPEHNILIDTCMGNDKERGGHAAFHQLRTPWLQNLAAAGLAPEQIDYVMCTHMHADHIGWNTRLSEGRWVPTFPNARYVFARREYDLTVEAAPGHTPGNIVIQLRSGEQPAVLSGDVVHHPMQICYPEHSAVFCEDPAESARCRQRFVERYADTATWILPAHFPAPTVGRIETRGTRWQYACA